MKKTLLGTTALVTAGLISSSAVAADPIELSLGGFFLSGVEAIVAESGPSGATERNTWGFTKDYEITFNGRTTLDNGITVGFHMELENPINARGSGASATGLRQDEQYVFVSGGFGEVRIGSIDGVVRDNWTKSPGKGIYAIGGQYNASNAGSFLTTSSGYPDTSANITGNDSEKIYYFSPRIAGLQVRASYSPGSAQGEADGGANQILTGGTNDAFEAGFDFNNSFGGVSIRGGAAYGHADAANTGGTRGNIDGLNASLGVGVAGFEVGGSWQYVNNVGGNQNSDHQAWIVGAGYSAGPVGVGLEYGQSTDGDGVQGQDTFTQVIAFTGAYQMGPGVEFSAGLNYTNGGSFGVADYESYALGAGLTLSF